MTPVICRLTPIDAPAYRAIRLEALQTDPDSFGARHDDEAAQPDPFFATRLATSAVFAADAAGTLVGMAAFQRHEGAGERHKAFVWGVFVRPSWRRRGLSQALPSALLEAADQLVEHVTLTVAADNAPARALYERLGFRTYGTEPRAYKTAAGYRDSTLMARLPPTA